MIELALDQSCCRKPAAAKSLYKELPTDSEASLYSDSSNEERIDHPTEIDFDIGIGEEVQKHLDSIGRLNSSTDKLQYY